MALPFQTSPLRIASTILLVRFRLRHPWLPHVIGSIDALHRLVEVERSQVVIGVKIIGLDRECFLVGLNGLVCIAEVVQHAAQAEPQDLIGRILLCCQCQVFLRFVKFFVGQVDVQFLDDEALLPRVEPTRFRQLFQRL